MEDEASSETLYILVVKRSNLNLLRLFMNNLKSMGVYVETVPGQTIDVIFIKISICLKTLQHFSEVFDIGNYEVSYKGGPIFACNPFATPVSVIEPKKAGNLTNAESIMIIHKVLETTKFGHSDNEYGISYLIRHEVLLDGYPLHEGPAKRSGYNDRSLLLRFWSHVGFLHREQPLDLIQRYFGHEVAFYFAWLEYFNISLLLPSLLGAIVLIISLFRVIFLELDEVTEICNDKDNFVCPVCEHSKKDCKFVPLSKFCTLSKMTYVFDNHFTVGFAVYMSFAASLFLALWRRKEHMLKMRWHASDEVDHSESSIRSSYREREKRLRRNKFNGQLEPYTPAVISIFRYTISVLICFGMIIIMILLLGLNISSMIHFRSFVAVHGTPYMKHHKVQIIMMLGAFLHLFYIKFMSLFFGPLTMKLTHFENPRTQSEFDNSLLYKRYLLAFVNSLMPLFYLAFVKGKLYTVPHENNFYYKQDGCQPLSCIAALCIQLTFLLTLRSFAGNIGNFLSPRIKALRKKIFHRKNTENPEAELPQWEKEYFLQPCGKYFLSSEYSEMMVKYALVTFFVGAFPLAPLCALINNLVELRTDAYKLVKAHRRPVPVIKGSIGTWNAILKITTFLSAATNAFVIAFTSDFIPDQLYHFESHAKSITYYNFTLSKYATKDYPLYQQLQNSAEFCLYKGHYNPGTTPDAYKTRDTYWIIFLAKFVVVFIFEHLVLLLNAALTYFIPKVPYSVEQKLYLDLKSKTLIPRVKQSLTKLLKVDLNYIT